MIYTIIGSAFDGNKGAASMLEAAIQTISARDKNADIRLLSMYPVQDTKHNTYKNVQVYKASALYLGVVINSLALLYVIPPLRPFLRMNGSIKAIADCDVFIDQGGITFVDGRGKFIIYNVASILPALFMRKPVVKCSQAMGPFKTPLNKTAAKTFLPRVRQIFARGAVTREHLDTLNLTNVTDAADYAFSLQYTDKDKKRVDGLLSKLYKPAKGKTKLYLLPSEVVRIKCTKIGIDYVSEMAQFIQKVPKKYEVLLIPHSMRFHTDGTHNNDVPLVEGIAAAAGELPQLSVFREEVSASEMRYLLSTPDLIIASRFHAMVSALANGVPVYVVGWSHKYKEVMDMFHIEGYAIDLKELSAQQLVKALAHLDTQAEKVRKSMRTHIAAVKKSSLQQADEIVAIAKRS